MEIWKKIERYPGYEVSNLGKIKSYKQSQEGRILQGKMVRGYIGIDFRVDGKTIQDLLHRVVLSTFNPIEGWQDMTVNHINGDILDNRLENLEWMTQSDNTKHARRVLKNGNGIKQVHIIFLDGTEKYFEAGTDAANYIGVARSTVSKWAKGQRNYKDKYQLVEYV